MANPQQDDWMTRHVGYNPVGHVPIVDGLGGDDMDGAVDQASAAAPAPDVISGADAKADAPAAQASQAEHALSSQPPAAVPNATADPNDGPHLGADLQVGYPWSIQGSLVIKDFNLRSFGDPKKVSVDLFHEPSLSLSLDPKSGLTGQALVGVLDLHFYPLWKKEAELSLNAFVNAQLSQQGPATYGGQLQLEEHVTGWLSVTLSLSGTAGDGFVVSPGGGLLFHYDPVKKKE